MLPTRRTALVSILSLLAFTLCGISLFAQSGGGTWEKDYVDLIPGRVVSDSLNLAGIARRSYHIEVPPEAFGIRIALEDSPADLDIYITDTRGDIYFYSESEDYNESIYLTKLTEPSLEAGSYTVEILYQLPKEPVVDGAPMYEIPYRLRMELIRPESEGPLIEGIPYTFALSPATGMLRTYELQIPEETPVFRVDLFDTRADLDLFVSYGRPVVTPWEADYSAQSLLSRERIVVAAEEEGRRYLRSGTYYVTVIDQIAANERTPFGISYSASISPPSFLLDLPELPVPESALERALLSTVEIVGGAGGGSGCLISPEGFILTNWHVVRGPSGMADESLVVSLSLDNSLPPRELFLAEVVEFDEERDLALLKVTGGLYGQPLPAQYRFPHFELAEGGLPSIGSDLGFIGYPGIGGTGSRVSVTYTRGIVSGYQATNSGTIIKTDGEINEGNSGGAAVDNEWRLVGLPTQIVGREAGRLGFVHPVDLVPAAWFERHGIAGAGRPSRDAEPVRTPE